MHHNQNKLHHMLDILNPDEAFSVSQYAVMARELIEQISVPLLVGGTGFHRAQSVF